MTFFNNVHLCVVNSILKCFNSFQNHIMNICRELNHTTHNILMASEKIEK